MDLRHLLTFALIIFGSYYSSAQPNSLPEINEKVLFRDLKILSADDMEGRQPGHPGHDKARDYVSKRFKEVGLSQFNNTYFQNFEFVYPRDSVHKFNGTNVLGFVKGKSAPEKFIAVTAHYDHLGVGKGEIFNGADDNASGTASLFTLADYFNKHQPEHSLLFVAVEAEERSGAGARQLVYHPPVDIQQIVMNVNIDMIARDTADMLFAVGTYHYPYLKPILDPVASRAPIKLLFGHDRPNEKAEDWTKQSDHYAFHYNKIPFIYFGVEDEKYHHSAADEYKNMTLPFYGKAVQTIILCIQELDKKLDEVESISKPTRKVK